MTEFQQLQELYAKLKRFQTIKQDNRIDFMEWIKYPAQNDARVAIHNRIRTKQGQNIFVVFGGNRCLGGEQKIYDPIKKASVSVKDIKDDFHVYAWDGKKRLKAKALKPFIKGVDVVYKVTFRSGSTAFLSLSHDLLGACGTYLHVSQLLTEGEVFLHRSTLVLFRLIHFLNALNLKSIFQGFLYGYHLLFRFYDELFHSVKDTVLRAFPLQVYAHKHTSSLAFSHKDVQNNKLKYTHVYQLTDHPSILDVLQLILGLFFDLLSYIYLRVLKFVLFSQTLALHILTVLTYPLLSIFLINQLGKCFLFFFSLCTSKDIITQLVEIGVQDIYDFEVPVYHNYFIDGIVSHNSGKSELGGGVIAEVFRDYQNKRVWCATLSDLSVKVQQKKLDSLIRKQDIQYGEYNLVRGWTNKTIIGKNGTVIYFKTYEQGASSFQGDQVDLIWFDEEMPWDVLRESMIRLADNQGIMLLTFTSLSGFTRVVNFVYESNNPNIYLTTLTAKDNPFLSDASKAQLLESIDPDEYESRWLGKPHLKTGLIYKTFRPEVHAISRFDYAQMARDNPSRFSIHEGIDPHTRTPHHWLRFLYDKKKDVLFVVDELKAPKESMLIDEFSRLIRAKRQRVQPEYCQIDTSSGTPDVIRKHSDEDQEDVVTIRTEFARCGIETVLVAKDNSLGIGAVNKRLSYRVDDKGNYLKRPRLFVFDDLDGFRWEIARYSWDSYATAKASEKKEMMNNPLKRDDHFMDVLKYECIKLIPYERDETTPTMPEKSIAGFDRPV